MQCNASVQLAQPTGHVNFLDGTPSGTKVLRRGFVFISLPEMTLRTAEAGARHDMECDATGEQCFICLMPGQSHRLLQAHCRCALPCHRGCLSRWQLQCSGTLEETHCRFCFTELPDWKDALLPKHLQAHPLPAHKPTISVQYGDQVFVLQVKPGPEGLAEFKSEVKARLGLPSEADFNVQFSVLLPSFGLPQAAHSSNGQLNLSGLSQFESVAVLAQARRSERALLQQQQRQPELPSCPPATFAPAVTPAQLDALLSKAKADFKVAQNEAAAAESRAAAATATAAELMAAYTSTLQSGGEQRHITAERDGRDRERSPVRGSVSSSSSGSSSCTQAAAGGEDFLQGLRIRTKTAQQATRQQHEQPLCPTARSVAAHKPLCASTESAAPGQGQPSLPSSDELLPEQHIRYGLLRAEQRQQQQQQPAKSADGGASSSFKPYSRPRQSSVCDLRGSLQVPSVDQLV